MDMDDDLQAFERRLEEIMAGQIRSMWFWRAVFVGTLAAIGNGARQYLRDGGRTDMTLLQFGGTYPLLCGGLLLMLLLVGFGIRRRMCRAQIMAQRMRYGLNLFGMSCNDNGQLIMEGPEEDSSDEAEISDDSESEP